MRGIPGLLILASCIFLECNGVNVHELETLPVNSIQELHPLTIGGETEEELRMLDNEIMRIEHARMTDRKKRVLSVAGCTGPDGDYHLPGEIYSRKCFCVLCFDGKEYSNGVRDPTCCSTANQNAYYPDGSTFWDGCDSYYCDNGTKTFTGPVIDCIYEPGMDDPYFPPFSNYTLNCVLHTCFATYCVPTDILVPDCCDGDFGPQQNGEVFIHDCDLYRCVDGDPIVLQTDVSSCCYNKESGEQVSNYEVFTQYCVEYICENGRVKETHNRTVHCCKDIHGLWYGNGVTYTTGCHAYLCQDGISVPINTTITECCANFEGEWFPDGANFTDRCVDYRCDGGMAVEISSPGYISPYCCEDGDGNWYANKQWYRYKCLMYECDFGVSIPLQDQIEECCYTSYDMWFKEGDYFSDHCTKYQCLGGERVFVEHPSEQCCIDEMMNWHADKMNFQVNCKAYKCMGGRAVIKVEPLPSCCTDSQGRYHENDAEYVDDCQTFKCFSGTSSKISGDPCP